MKAMTEQRRELMKQFDEASDDEYVTPEVAAAWLGEPTAWINKNSANGGPYKIRYEYVGGRRMYRKDVIEAWYEQYGR